MGEYLDKGWLHCSLDVQYYILVGGVYKVNVYYTLHLLSINLS